jgi:hypothetical protein
VNLWQVWAAVELQNAAWETEFRDRLGRLEAASVRRPETFDLFRGSSSGPEAENGADFSEEEDDVVFDDDLDDEDDEQVEDEEDQGVENLVNF